MNKRRHSACVVYEELRDRVAEVYLIVLCEYDGALELGTIAKANNTVVILYLRKKSRSLVHRCLVYQVCATGVTRRGKASTKLTRITMIKRFF